MRVSIPPGGAGAFVPAGGELHVAKSGRKYTVIQDAIDDASPGQTVMVHTGNYAESITLKFAVPVISASTQQTVIISGADATSTRVTMSDITTLENITVHGPVSGANPVIDTSAVTGAGIAALAQIAVVGQGGTGPAVLCGGAGTVTVLIGFYHISGNFSSVFNLTSGNLILEESFGSFGSCDDFILQTGGDLIVRKSLIQNSTFYACTDYLHISGGTAVLDLVSLPENSPSVVNGLHIAADGLDISIESTHLHASAFDILVDPALTGVGTTLSGSFEFRIERFSGGLAWALAVDAAILQVDTGVNDDPGVSVLGAFNVGNSLRGFESNFGEGNSTTLGMKTLSFDGTATYVDLTSILASRAGSTTPIFQGTGVDNSLIMISQTPRKFPDIVIDVTTAAVLGGGALVFEYTTGAGAWTAVPVMGSNDAADTQYPNQGVLQNVEKQHIRYNSPAIAGTWVTDTINGVTGYGLRVRITSVIGTIPEAERVKLGTNRVSVTETAVLEGYGNAVQEEVLPGVTLGNAIPLTGSAAPGNSNILVSPNIQFSASGNLLGQGDGLGWPEIPGELGDDTSRPVKFDVDWTPTTTGTGTVVLALNTATWQNGDVFDGSSVADNTPVTDTTTLSIASNDVVFTTTLELDVSALSPVQALSAVISHTAAGSYGGSVRIVAVKASRSRWII